jgi:hypothetical protein
MENSLLTDMLPDGFADNAKVWIYQSSRAFVDKEEKEINEQLYQFYAQWQSHGAPVKGWAKLLFSQFIVVLADETEVMVGGCSTDGSVRVIKSIERQYDVNFFDRMMLIFLVKNKAQMLPFSQVQYAIDNGYIDGNTLLFNNVVANKGELIEKWIVPLNQSWLAGKVNLNEKIAG